MGFRLLLLQLFTSVLGAQVFPPPQPYTLWRQSQLVVFPSPEGTGGVIRLESPGRREEEIPLPEWAGDPDWADGSYWVSRPERVKGEARQNLFRSEDGRSWRWECAWPEKSGLEWRIVPLFNGRFLIIAATSFEKDGVKSPLGIAAKQGNGTLVLEEVLPLGLDKLQPPPPTERLTPGLFKGDATWMRHFVSLASGVARYPDGLVVFASRPGYFWILDDSSARVKVRFVRLFESVTEERLKKGPLGWAVLGVQPRPDGHLLVASRSEASVLSGVEQMPEVKTMDGEGESIHVRKRDQAFLAHPELEWWDLDPKSGAFRRDPGPQGVPTRFSEASAVGRFTFRFKPDGNLHIEPGCFTSQAP